jgi:hypothetical protein
MRLCRTYASRSPVTRGEAVTSWQTSCKSADNLTVTFARGSIIRRNPDSVCDEKVIFRMPDGIFFPQSIHLLSRQAGNNQSLPGIIPFDLIKALHVAQVTERLALIPSTYFPNTS